MRERERERQVVDGNEKKRREKWSRWVREER